jgi:hypothetical protein
VVNSRKIRSGYVAHIGELRHVYRVLVGNLEEISLGDLKIDWRIVKGTAIPVTGPPPLPQEYSW